MNCVVCGDQGPCEFCKGIPPSLKVLAELHEERTPATLTVFDQEHARAIEELRGAHTYVVAWVGDNGIGSAVGNCREEIWLTAACGLAEQAIRRVREDME